jgi:hypothetical protein
VPQETQVKILKEKLKYQPVVPIELPEPLAGIPFTPYKFPSTTRSPAANEQLAKIHLHSSFNYFSCFEQKIKEAIQQ